MAKKKETAKKEVSRETVNGVTIIRFDDGTVQFILEMNMDQLQAALGISESEEEEEEEEEEPEEEDDDDDDSEEETEEETEEEGSDDDDDDSEEEEEELSPEDLMAMDFDELEDLCEDNDLETDPDDYDEKDIEKLRQAIAEEIGIELPKPKKEEKKKVAKKK